LVKEVEGRKEEEKKREKNKVWRFLFIWGRCKKKKVPFL
jgi:hypothetical protein